jgi:hypothetical protein
VEKVNILRKQPGTREAELMHVQLALIESRIASLEHDAADQEGRLRVVEASRIRLETLAWLAFGGGAASFVNILLAAFTRMW